MSNVLASLAKAIGPLAPTLATMLGGPLAGAAVSALEGAFGLAPGSGADGITQVVQTGAMSPDAMAAVRAADQKHAEIISQQGIDLAKLNAAHDEAFAQIDAGDRDSARKREMAVKDWTPSVLAFATFVLYAGVQWFILTRVVNDDMREIVMRSLGTLDAAVAMVLGYYFGSSASSKSKDALLLSAVPAK